jgi:hypothetical protein
MMQMRDRYYEKHRGSRTQKQPAQTGRKREVPEGGPPALFGFSSGFPDQSSEPHFWVGSRHQFAPRPQNSLVRTGFTSSCRSVESSAHKEGGLPGPPIRDLVLLSPPSLPPRPPSPSAHSAPQHPHTSADAAKAFPIFSFPQYWRPLAGASGGSVLGFQAAQE